MENFIAKSFEFILLIAPIGLLIGMVLGFLGKDKVRYYGISLFAAFSFILLSQSIFKTIFNEPYFIPVEIIDVEHKPETIPLLTSEKYQLVFKTENNVIFKGECNKKIYYSYKDKKGDKVQVKVVEEPKDNTEIYIDEFDIDIKPLN